MRQEVRARQIKQIEASIKARKKGKEINKKMLILATMANLNLSRGTSRDYVEIALFNLGLANE